jgi:hypothetical protein
VRTAFLFLCLATFAVAADDEGLSLMRVPFERGSQTPPAVSVFLDLGYGGIGRKQPHAVIACIWPDGRAVWSRDRSRGGPPYFTARIDPKRLTEFIATLDSKGFFARKVWYSVGVDSEHHDINILDGQRRVAFSATGYYNKNSNKPPELITEVPDAFAYLRQQLERLLPRQGEQLPAFDYELRRLQ